MKKIFTITLILIAATLSYSQDSKYLPTINQGTVVRHQNYILSYVEEYEGSEWVCYELTYSETRNNVDRRNGKFLSDDSINTKSAEHDDYTNSGFDRGHLAPAGDMNFSADAEYESFYMSNVLPQTPGLNRKTWKYLEDDIREYVIRHKSHLYIITGGVFSMNPNYIGVKNKVAIPEYFYKIIFDDATNQIMSFIMPNIENPNIDYMKYISFVDEVEFFTSIDFFPTLGEKMEGKQVQGINWLKK